MDSDVIGGATSSMPILASSLAGITLIIVMRGAPYSGHSRLGDLMELACWMEESSCMYFVEAG